MGKDRDNTTDQNQPDEIREDDTIEADVIVVNQTSTGSAEMITSLPSHLYNRHVSASDATFDRLLFTYNMLPGSLVTKFRISFTVSFARISLNRYSYLLRRRLGEYPTVMSSYCL